MVSSKSGTRYLTIQSVTVCKATLVHRDGSKTAIRLSQALSVVPPICENTVINCDKSAKIDLLWSVVNLFLSTYTKIYMEKNFILATQQNLQC